MIIRAFLHDTPEGLSFCCPKCQDEDHPIIINTSDGDLPYCTMCGPRYKYDVLKIDEKKEKIEVMFIDMEGLEMNEEDSFDSR